MMKKYYIYVTYIEETDQSIGWYATREAAEEDAIKLRKMTAVESAIVEEEEE